MIYKILVIEDDTAILENICEFLEPEGYKLECAVNGKQGFEKIKSFEPDVIISDISMPEMNGLELLEKVRQEKIITTFVFLSAHVGMPNIRGGMNLGADDYLTKPFTRKDLLDAVRSRLERAKLVRYSVNQEIQQKVQLERERIRHKMLSDIPDEFGNLLNGIAGSFFCLRDSSSPEEAEEAYQDGIYSINKFHDALKSYFQDIQSK